MNEEEIRIRKQWLTLQITSIILGCISIFFPVANTIPPEIPSETVNLIKCVLLAITLAFQYLLYHCAYKKRGTKLLTAVLVLTVVGTIVTLASHVFGNIRLTTLGYLVTAFQLILSAAWFFTGLKLRAFNKNFKTTFLSPPDG